MLRQVAFFDPQSGYGLFETRPGDGCGEAVGRTGDGGATFGPLVTVTSGPCGTAVGGQGLAFSDHGDGFVYGPALFTSHDGGARWAAVPEPGPVEAVVPLGSSVWMVTADCPAGAGPLTPCALQVSQSDDGGRQWHPAATQPPVAARSSATLPEPAQGQSWLVRTGVDTAYVVGPPAAPTASGVPDDAPLAWTGNGGRTWARRQIPCAVPALSVALSAAPDGALVAACASQPAAGYQPKSAAVSTDGGRTWAQRGPCQPGGCAPSPLTGGYLGTIDALSATEAFVIGPRSQLDQTTDGGATWTGRSDPGDTAGGGAQVVFFDARHGLVLGDTEASGRVAIWHTSDGGASWSTFTRSGSEAGRRAGSRRRRRSGGGAYRSTKATRASSASVMR